MAAKLNWWLLATLVLIAIFYWRAITPSSDAYWHLSVGREVVQTHKIPTQDNFVYSAPNSHYVSTEWLAGLIMYLSTIKLGFMGVMILRVVLGTITLLTFYKTLELFSRNLWLNLLLLSSTAYCFSYRFYDRPESISFVFLAVINYTLLKYYFKNNLSKLIFIFPVIFLLWPNIHGYFLIGTPLFLFYIFIFILQTKRTKTKLPDFRIFISVSIISLILFCAQAQRIIAFVLSTRSLKNVEIGEFQTIWQRLFFVDRYDFLNSISRDLYIYFLTFAIFIFLLTISFKKEKLQLSSLISLLYFGLFASAFTSLRLVSTSLMLSIPYIVYQAKSNLTIKKTIMPITKFCFAAFVVFFVISIFSKKIYGYRELATVNTFSSQAGGPVISAVVVYDYWTQKFPTKAPEILNKYTTASHLFTVNYWGNFMIWKSPQIKIFSDSMVSYIQKEQRDDEAHLLIGAGDWEKLLGKYQIDAVINSQQFEPTRSNLPVYKLRNWKLIFVDENFALYGRRDTIKNLPYSLEHIHPELQTRYKFKDNEAHDAEQELIALYNFDPTNAFAREQLITYWLDTDIEKAQNLALESKIKIPDNPMFSLLLSEIYDKKNMCTEALNFAEEARTKSFNEPILSMRIKGVEKHCGS